MPDSIENIANLIIEEAANIPGEDLLRAVYHVKLLVNLKLGEMTEVIRNGMLAEKLKKEILSD